METTTNEITEDYKKRVITGLFSQRENFEGSDTVFANQYGFKSSVLSRFKNGETIGLLSPEKWRFIGRKLGISPKGERQMKLARTDVFVTIEQDIDFCQQYSKAKIFVDDCEIGKTVAAK